ncbi:hypothetical protein KY345_04695 [Candidatus Woesearchaeota archaeon]|nr:hypothetical protein [Candidatus Woesearchaeota archaeon]
MDKGQEILGIDFPTVTIEAKNLADIIEGMETITDSSIHPSIETDFRIARFLRGSKPSKLDGKFEFYPEFFKSYDSVRTPYRFAHVPQEPKVKEKTDNLGYHTTAAVVEAYLVGGYSTVDRLDDVRNIVLVSFFVPVLFSHAKGIHRYYNKGNLESIDYENIFQRTDVSESEIRKLLSKDVKIDFAVTPYSIFSAFDPTKKYEEQRERASAFFSALKEYKDDIPGYETRPEERKLPEIMHQEGLKMSVPKITEEAIKRA